MKVVNKTTTILAVELGRRPPGEVRGFPASSIPFWQQLIDPGQSMEYAIAEKPPASGLTFEYVVTAHIPSYSGMPPMPNPIAPPQIGISVDCPADATVVFSTDMMLALLRP